MAGNSNYIPTFGSYNLTISRNSTMQSYPVIVNESYNCSAVGQEMPSLAIFFWTLVFGAMIATAAIGNLIVLWIVLAHRRMRTVTNYFIINLALADVINAIFHIPFPFSYYIHNDWYYGEIYCKIQRFVGPTTVSASIFTLMAIGIDRYIAIVHPMRPRMSKLKAKSIIAIVWMISAAISIPYLEFTLTLSDCSSRTICVTIWPDGEVYGSWYLWYTYSSAIATYVIPLFAQGICYTIVGIKLWGSRAPGESSKRHKEQLKAKRKVVKMLLVVVVIFAFCWLPVHVYFVLGHYLADVVYNYEHIQHVYMAIFWLAMSNSMYNPFIYCWLNDSYRMGFRKAFHWLPCVSFSKDRWSRVLGPVYTRVTYNNRTEASSIGNSAVVSGRRYAASHASNGHRNNESTHENQAL